MKMPDRSALSLFAAALLLCAIAKTARGQDFYKDKTIRFIVGQAAGGGYDAYTRAIAHHMVKHIPGNPAFTAENMTGAGSLVAANYVYGNTKPDGLTIGNWNSAFVLNQALGDPNVRFDARRFGWIGAPSKGIPVCVIMGFTGLKTWEDVAKSPKPIRMGGTAPGSHSIDLPLMLNRMLGTKFAVISGYQGTSQIRVAMQRREADGTCTNWDSLIATHRDMIEAKGDGALIAFVVHSRIDDPRARDLPLFTQVLKDDSNVATYRAYMSQMEYQRPLTIAPGAPKDRLEVLRKAFKATLADPEFLAQAEKLKLDVTLVSGEEIERIVNEVLSVSPKIKENLKFLEQSR